jgi:hypothetical protein
MTMGTSTTRRLRPWAALGAFRPSALGAALCLLAVGGVLAGCGSSLIGSATTTSPTPTGGAAAPTAPTATTSPLTGEVAVAFPVVACTTASGAPLGSSGWKPTIVLAPIPTALVGTVEFYSDGVHTVLGPNGWTCAQTPPIQGATGLVVYPPGVTDPSLFGNAPVGSEGVFATFAITDTPHGVALVCPFFTVPQWQQSEAHCNGTKPFGEQSTMPTPDVASVTDPAGVPGSLQGSGGDHPVTGAVIFPQVIPAVTDGSSVNIAVESCALTNTALCPTILTDFEVREFPEPIAT